MSATAVMNKTNLLLDTAQIEQTISDLNQAINDGDVLSVIAQTSILASSIPGPVQVGLSVTSSGLTFANAMEKVNNGTVEPKHVLDVMNSVLTRLGSGLAL